MNENFVSSLFLPALEKRETLLQKLHAEQTTCYRLFHGTNEGWPGLTIDRYGNCLLVQTWREPIDTARLEELRQLVLDTLDLDLIPVWNHRAKRGSADHTVHPVEFETPPTGKELGLVYDTRPRHRGWIPCSSWTFELAVGTSKPLPKT